MNKLRENIESYVRKQNGLRAVSLKLSVNLKNFGDCEVTELGNFLSSFGEALHAREFLREEATNRINLYSIEPLKLYHVKLFI